MQVYNDYFIIEVFATELLQIQYASGYLKQFYPMASEASHQLNSVLRISFHLQLLKSVSYRASNFEEFKVQVR
jgi:hypothetical protein